MLTVHVCGHVVAIDDSDGWKVLHRQFSGLTEAQKARVVRVAQLAVAAEAMLAALEAAPSPSGKLSDADYIRWYGGIRESALRASRKEIYVPTIVKRERMRKPKMQKKCG